MHRTNICYSERPNPADMPVSRRGLMVVMSKPSSAVAGNAEVCASTSGPAMLRQVVSIFRPLLDRQLHKYRPPRPRDTGVSHRNVLIVHIASHPHQPCGSCRASLLHLGKRRHVA